MPSEGDLQAKKRAGAVVVPIDVLDVQPGDTLQCGKKFIMISRIAGGASGNVWRAKAEDSSEIVAIKVLNRSRDRQVSKRAMLITTLLHEFAAPGLPYLCWPEGIAKFKENDCILTKLYGMDLRRLIKNDELFPLSSDHSQAMIWQIFRGLHYLHEVGIAHGDIKPENILLADESIVHVRRLQANGTFLDELAIASPEIKIADLDDARLPTDQPAFPAGTCGYRSPEVTRGSDWGTKADIFSAACTAFELLTGEYLFPEQLPAVKGAQWNGKDYSFLPELGLRWGLVKDKEAVALMRKAVTRNEKKRPTALTVLRHRYFGGLTKLHGQ